MFLMIYIFWPDSRSKTGSRDRLISMNTQFGVSENLSNSFSDIDEIFM